MVVRFADFELDVAARALRRSGEPLPLEPRAFDLLVHLVRNADRVVGRDEMLRVVWPGVRVTRASVDQAIRSIRRALGDDARAPRFVRTLSRRGVQFVGASAASPAARAGSFVGRSAPLALLRERLDAVERRAGGVVLITGPAGIGKTRTASEVLGWARERGLGTATVWKTEGASAAAPWRSLAQSLGADASELDRAAASGALFPALRGALDAACARVPFVALVDDLHDADVASIEFLDYLAGHPRGVALLAIATSRPAAELASAAAARALDRLRSRSGVAQLALGPLSAAEVAELIAVETGSAPAPERAEALAGRLQGNPFWILQLLRSRAAAALAIAGDEAWEQLAERGLAEVLGDRLAQLSAAEVHALETAAVLGDEIDASLVASACGLSGDAARAALAAGARAGLVVSPAAQRGGRFAHPLLRDALLAGVPAARLAQLHAAAARALETLPAPHDAERAAAIAPSRCSRWRASCWTPRGRPPSSARRCGSRSRERAAARASPIAPEPPSARSTGRAARACRPRSRRRRWLGPARWIGCVCRTRSSSRCSKRRSRGWDSSTRDCARACSAASRPSSATRPGNRARDCAPRRSRRRGAAATRAWRPSCSTCRSAASGSPSRPRSASSRSRESPPTRPRLGGEGSRAALASCSARSSPRAASWHARARSSRRPNARRASSATWRRAIARSCWKRRARSRSARRIAPTSWPRRRRRSPIATASPARRWGAHSG
jgi:DNA-binding winged helix-turn-helix (wHTH) protein